VTDTNVVQLSQPGTFADTLTEVLRLTNSARALPAQAVGTSLALPGLCCCLRHRKGLALTPNCVATGRQP